MLISHEVVGFSFTTLDIKILRYLEARTTSGQERSNDGPVYLEDALGLYIIDKVIEMVEAGIASDTLLYCFFFFISLAVYINILSLVRSYTG